MELDRPSSMFKEILGMSLDSGNDDFLLIKALFKTMYKVKDYAGVKQSYQEYFDSVSHKFGQL